MEPLQKKINICIRYKWCALQRLLLALNPYNVLKSDVSSWKDTSHEMSENLISPRMRYVHEYCSRSTVLKEKYLVLCVCTFNIVHFILFPRRKNNLHLLVHKKILICAKIEQETLILNIWISFSIFFLIIYISIYDSFHVRKETRYHFSGFSRSEPRSTNARTRFSLETMSMRIYSTPYLPRKIEHLELEFRKKERDRTTQFKGSVNERKEKRQSERSRQRRSCCRSWYLTPRL